MNNSFHIPVLLNDCITGLNIDPNGIYADVTFGGGGHSKEILNNLDKGKLFGFDQDSDAANNIIDNERFFFINSNFRYIKNFLQYYGYTQIDGILADLGVSSFQFDTQERGFSFRFDSELDMRMNKQSKITAKELINNYSVQQLTEILKHFGEISNAQQIAKAIVSSRSVAEIAGVHDLVKAIEKYVPKRMENKYLAQIFQAFRIEVNQELECLKELLTAANQVLKPGGRLVVITYHSLEDRLVKNFMKAGNFDGTIEKDFYGNSKSPFRAVNKKIIIPDENEIKLNNRARSAKLRIAEKL